ncbi:hypothetical protein BH23CHL4_BH23CHL4_04290 [soil metagenome]
MTNEYDRIRFGIIAEIHRAAAGSPRLSWHNELLLDRTEELLDLAIAKIELANVDNLVLLGDLTNGVDDASFGTVLSAVSKTGIPVLAVPGNHDIAMPGGMTRFGHRLQGSEVTAAPAALREAGATPVVLIGIERDRITNRLQSSSFPDPSPYNGETLIVFSHFPLLAMTERLNDAGFKHAGDLSDRQEITDQLLRHDGPVIVVHGHLHLRASAVEGNMLHLSCAALVEPPHEVSVVSVAGYDTSNPAVRLESTSIMTSNVNRLPVLDPAEQDWRYTDNGWSRS